MKTVAKDLKVRVKLGARSYDVQVGSGAIDRVGICLRGAASKRAYVISDERLKEARERTLASFRNAGWETHEIPVTAGEELKEFDRLYPLYGALLSKKANRDSTLVALGGGTIGDAAGFVASTFLRGIPWVGVPTTLLAQVDSSVGGKTGINHEFGKNLVGTFYQPKLVICELDFLRTLSKREVISGLGEAIKYGLVFDPKFFNFLRDKWDPAMSLDSAVMGRVVRRSLEWKSKVVSKDEYDKKGVREALNFGHTFGHALETATGYSEYQHGEAVIWGMRFALALSLVRRKIGKKVYEEADGFLRRIPVLPLPEHIKAETYFRHMTKDKKVRNGKLHFVLLNGLGHAFSDSRVTEGNLFAAYEHLNRSV